jgi:hypothetical protein
LLKAATVRPPAAFVFDTAIGGHVESDKEVGS